MARLPCPPEHWPEFSSLLNTALDLPVADRAAWLDSLSAAHAHLRPLLEQVLAQAADDDSSEFLKTPMLPAPPDSEFAPGQCIGPYTLESELGHGGMGEVWLASRSDGTLGRRVALKLPHAHLLAGALRQRFERERDILASLSHPNIAALYDAGISEGGYPYLAMEWIEGTPITHFCRASSLPVERRLQLVKQILAAVSYAHSRLIAHRDLKPANILVTADGQVKLLDFGVAKLLGDGAEGNATELTRLSGRAVTPGYAAPEQLAGGAITTAVDLYALGVLLFELLTGTRLFGGADNSRHRAFEAPLASRQVSEESSASIGGLSAAQLRKLLQGDLDAIVARALENDPMRRYGSAEGFAADIDHYFRHEPITARRVSRLTLARKFVRRHRAGTALSASLVLALLTGAAGVTFEALRAEREARAAEKAAQVAEQESRREKATKDFLVSVFKASDPRIASDKPRGMITAKELLDVSSSRIGTEFAHDPATEIELLGTLADIYIVLDESDRSVQLLQREVELARIHEGRSSKAYINGLLLEADAQSSLSRYKDALQTLAEADVALREAGLDASASRALWWYEKAGALVTDNARREERKAALERSVELFSVAAPRDSTFPHALSDLGGIYYAANDLAKAAEYVKRSIALDESGVDPDQAHLTSLYANLGKLLIANGELDGAVGAFQKASSMASQAYGMDSRFYWTANAHWAMALHLLGERIQAHEIFSSLLPHLPSKYRNAEEEQSSARVREVYGNCLLAEGQAVAAIAVYQDALAGYGEAKQDSSSELRVRGQLAQAYARAGRIKEARRAFEDLTSTVFATPNLANPRVLSLRQAWGELLLRQGELDQAERQFEEVLARGTQNSAPVALSLGGRAQIALARHDIALALQSSLQAVDAFERVSGFRDVRMGPQLWRIRAEALLRSGQAKDALPWAQRALEADRRYDDPLSADLAAAQGTANQVLKAAGRLANSVQSP